MLKLRQQWPPFNITTDKNLVYGKAARELKWRGKVPSALEHRQAKYLHDRLEADHRGADA